MPCRVGITMDLDRRRREQERVYPTLRSWRRESTHRSKSAAQAAERRIARQRGCDAHPGGAGPEYATWYVYSFRY